MTGRAGESIFSSVSEDRIVGLGFSTHRFLFCAFVVVRGGRCCLDGFLVRWVDEGAGCERRGFEVGVWIGLSCWRGHFDKIVVSVRFESVLLMMVFEEYGFERDVVDVRDALVKKAGVV